MKTITLLPVKNEDWILDFSLTNFSIFSDEIIILDDESTDTSFAIAQKYPKVKIIPFTKNEVHVDMSARRSILLEKGRLSGGTHFVFLDADETLSENFCNSVNETIHHMEPGEVLMLPWVLIKKETRTEKLYFNAQDKVAYKDFIFCDDGVSMFKQQFLSEARTPGDHNKKRYLPFTEGFVLHFMNLPKKRYQLKQAWYRCNELVEGTRSAKRINATYDYTRYDKVRKKIMLDEPFTAKHLGLINQNASYEFYMRNITALFEQHGIEFFEPLDIWHIPELNEIFVKKIGKKPHPQTFPRSILFLNAIKNRIKNGIL